MRTYEMRVYTLASEEAVAAYLTVYYPNHELSLAKLYDVTVHGYWGLIGADAHRVYVLMSYPEGADPDAVRARYRADPVSGANMPGFDPSVIHDVSCTLLAPAATSPLL